MAGFYVDVFVSKRIRDVATLSSFTKAVAGPSAAVYATLHGLSDLESVAIGSSVSVIAIAVQQILDTIASHQEDVAVARGKAKLLTRLDVWMGNKRAIKNSRVQ